MVFFAVVLAADFRTPARVDDLRAADFLAAEFLAARFVAHLRVPVFLAADLRDEVFRGGHGATLRESDASVEAAIGDTGHLRRGSWLTWLSVRERRVAVAHQQSRGEAEPTKRFWDKLTMTTPYLVYNHNLVFPPLSYPAQARR